MRPATILVLFGAVVSSACTTEASPEPAPQATGPVATTGAGDGTDDASGVASGEPADLVVPEGFDRVQATVTEPDGTVCELCVWIADTAERRGRGLMFVTDLGPADAMAFVYPAPHSGSFWMKNTLLPLSIAFFDDAGRYLDAFDMEPCTGDPCPQYTTPDGFVVAVEVERGSLPSVGIVPGSVLALSEVPCPG